MEIQRTQHPAHGVLSRGTLNREQVIPMPLPGPSFQHSGPIQLPTARTVPTRGRYELPVPRRRTREVRPTEYPPLFSLATNISLRVLAQIGHQPRSPELRHHLSRPHTVRPNGVSAARAPVVRVRRVDLPGAPTLYHFECCSVGFWVVGLGQSGPQATRAFVKKLLCGP